MNAASSSDSAAAVPAQTRRPSVGPDDVADMDADLDSVPPSYNPFFTYRLEKQMENEDLKTLVNDEHQKNDIIHTYTSDPNPPYNKVEIHQATTEYENSAEFRELRTQLQRCVRMRHFYQDISRQLPGQNPKDTWKAPVVDGMTPPFDPFNAEVPGRGAVEATHTASPTQGWTVRMHGGVYYVYAANSSVSADTPNGVHEPSPASTHDTPASPHALPAGVRAVAPKYHVPSVSQFYNDLNFLLSFAADGPAKSFCFRRLTLLETKFTLHIQLNDVEEKASCKLVPHRDFYNVRKVDTHVHHSASMNQKHLLRFIKSKLKRCPKDVVIYRDGRYLTLEQVFQSLKLTAYDLSIDTLDMHAHVDAFHRFDQFNLKYNPIGESRLREIFLKTDNYVKGRYLAELTREVMSDLEDSKYQMAEYRISVYGRSADEWEKLAAWVCDNKVFSPNVRWLVQVPRLYTVYKQSGIINNFEDVLRNLFKPLYDVTLDPSSSPKLHRFLQQVVGFDSVDDESKPVRRIHKKYPPPALWDLPTEPPYSYYIYYMWANLVSLNQLRQERGFGTLVLRPHAGEAGQEAHENLAVTYMLSQAINHGILLRKTPALQYLYYLDQVGIAMSPLSNNALFLHYDRNPFPEYFRRGMNVSISTDDPLLLHFTREPLIEEYSIAAQIWRLSAADMCEIARNSVLQSGFELALKKYWIGEQCETPGPAGNDINRTNVPNIRLSFREATLTAERAMALGDAFRANTELPPIQMDPLVHVEDVGPAVLPAATHHKFVQLVDALIAAQHLGDQAIDGAVPASAEPSPNASASATEAILDGTTHAAKPPTAADASTPAAPAPTAAPLPAAPVPSAGPATDDGQSPARTKHRFSVLTSIGLLGATQKRRATADDNVGVTSISGSGSGASADGDGPGGPLAS